MSLVPAFELGVWNAWIFMVINFLPMPILSRIHKDLMQDTMKLYGGSLKKTYYVTWTLWTLAFVYAFFLPLRLGTIWFYTGLPIALVGVVTYIIVMVNFATTSISEEPISTGIYRYSRHPMYVTQLLLFLGVGIASASWLFLLLTMVYAGLAFRYAEPEEHYCLEKYGDAYRDYMNRTPRWLGMPKQGVE